VVRAVSIQNLIYMEFLQYYSHNYNEHVPQLRKISLILSCLDGKCLIILIFIRNRYGNALAIKCVTWKSWLPFL